MGAVALQGAAAPDAAARAKAPDGIIEAVEGEIALKAADHAAKGAEGQAEAIVVIAAMAGLLTTVAARIAPLLRHQRRWPR